MTYPNDIDQECVALCDVLNALPGIRTLESCCGHGEHPFLIAFTATALSDLQPILECLSVGTPWRVEARWANGGNLIYFVLEGPKMSDTFDMRSVAWLVDELPVYANWREGCRK